MWLHTNCMLYTPECFVEYPLEGENGDRTSGSGKGGSTDGSAMSPKGSSSSRSGGRASGSKAVYFGVDEARKRMALKCTSCHTAGALIGCNVASCQVNTHYACAVREGWLFGDQPDAEGKVRCLWYQVLGICSVWEHIVTCDSPRRPCDACACLNVAWNVDIILFCLTSFLIVRCHGSCFYARLIASKIKSGSKRSLRRRSHPRSLVSSSAQVMIPQLRVISTKKVLPWVAFK